jgi:hypothetical protein
MANLELYVDVASGKTFTKIGKKPTDKIVFHNDSDTDSLVVNFSPTNVVKNKHGSAFISSITVPAGGEETVRFEASLETEVKYTAQIGSTTAEDPIIIID